MSRLLDTLGILVSRDNKGANLNEELGQNIENAYAKLELQPEEPLQLVKDIEYFNQHDSTLSWKFIRLAFHILLSIKKNTDVTVTQAHIIKTCFQYIVSLGTIPNLLPGVGEGLLTKQPIDINELNEPATLIEQYYRLAGTTKGLLLCMQSSVLRYLLIANHLTDLMASLIQLSYVPLKKPSSQDEIPNDKGFTFTKTLYENILKDRQMFNAELITLMKKSHRPLIMRELMVLYGNKSKPPAPSWLKRTLFTILNCKLQESKGVESIIRAMIDFGNYDTGAEWKQLDVIVRLLMTKPTAVNVDDYYKNICDQVFQLLDEKATNGKVVPQFEAVVAISVKHLHESHLDICAKYFIPMLLLPLEFYAENNTEEVKSDINVTFKLEQSIRILYSTFVSSTASNFPALPSGLLTRFLKILFRIFVILSKSSFATSKNHLQDVLVKCLNGCSTTVRNKMFQALLFDKHVIEAYEMRKDLDIYTDSDNVIVKPTDYKTMTSKDEASDCFCELLKSETTDKLSLHMFGFLLQDIVRADEPAERTKNKELLHLEDQFLLDDETERKLITLKLLSTLTEDPKTQKHLAKYPNELLTFIENVISISITKNVHTQNDFETSEFQALFVTVMILQATVTNSEKIDLQTFPIMLKYLHAIKIDCKNPELKNLAGAILNNCSGAKYADRHSSTEVDKAIEDICDPLLPVRAHGLMALAKLIEKKDPDAMSRKQYLLNIFLQNLKNDDSYIYLSAIGGLAAMCYVFTDTVLTTLCDEYSEFANRDIQNKEEVRMKVGEVLVRVVKSLGEVAPKYKPLLLNTFLLACKDDDHLIRASSLSNLGMVCRVLGYKLGSIISEVLVCIHSIISTDKAVEARRAAVTVICQLFVGLESEMIAFLKEDILPIYRTLKNIYNNDPDDVMRLQAQLALEQLNENMKEFVFPKLSLEKRVVMPN